jgi:diguanylate cyclase (GGDEF)-like protein
MGHLVGDFVLRELAQIIRVMIRREDLFARYGGEEFALVLVESPRTDAAATAERIRHDVEQHEFRFDRKHFHITISCGVADCEGDPKPTPMSLIQRADEKLYEAKRAGRNRVVG